MIPALLRMGFAKLPGIRDLAASEGWRDWFYHRARVSHAEAMRRRLGGRKVIVIGDAMAPGKSVAAIRSAFEAAYGVTIKDERLSLGA
jgi:hypothetical protein